MNSAAKHLRGFLEWLDVYREQGLVDVETTAKEIAEKMDVICEFRPVRTRKKRRIFSYECEDSNNQNPRYLFKTDYFLQIIDSIKQSMTERFEQLQAFVDKFEVIRDIASLRVETRDQINNKCGRLEVSLSDRENFDINGDDLSEELSCLSYILPEKTSAKYALKYLVDHFLTDAYPNTVVALRIFLTAPITVAAAERSFSRLKLIKTYLRSTISQERLNSLALLSIEKDIVKQVDFSKLIDSFAQKKARKVLL